MTGMQEFSKIESDEGAIAFCKRIMSGETENPLTKSGWLAVITAQAEANAD